MEASTRLAAALVVLALFMVAAATVAVAAVIERAEHRPVPVIFVRDN